MMAKIENGIRVIDVLDNTLIVEAPVYVVRDMIERQILRSSDETEAVEYCCRECGYSLGKKLPNFCPNCGCAVEKPQRLFDGKIITFDKETLKTAFGAVEQ